MEIPLGHGRPHAKTDRGVPDQPRLLVLTPDFPPAYGGIQLLVRRVVENLERFEPRVVALDQDGAEEFDRSAGIGVHRTRRIPIPKVTNAMLNVGALREARAFRPDLVLNAHIVTSPAATMLRRISGTPFVQYLHADEVAVQPRLARLGVTRAEANIAVSSYTAGLARDAGANADRVHQIPPGVDLPEPSTVARSDRPTVVTVARLTDRYKGHDVMIEAMLRVRAELPDAAWVVIGDGPLEKELIGFARSAGLGDTVIFTGAVSDAERDAWLDRAHVFAMPSRLPPSGRGGEGFGIVYLEAGAHSLPVVAGNVAGAVDAVVDGETGLLVDPADPDAVAGALLELLCEPELARRLGAAGAKRAPEFTWPRIAARVEDLLVATLEAPRAGR
jgi:phosphatidylinositol alpha-1,6-mannosyltransferase